MRSSLILKVSLLFCLTFTASSEPQLRDQTSEDSYWLASSPDNISYRPSPSGPVHDFKGWYNPLRPKDEILCKPRPASSPTPAQKRAARVPRTCTIDYITGTSSTPETLTDQVPVNRWIEVSLIPGKKDPIPPQLVPTPRQLLEEMTQKTRPAGLSKASGCTGEFAVLAPACLEAIDIDDFNIEWAPSTGSGAYLSVFLDTLDEAHLDSIRLDRIAFSRGQFVDRRITQFLHDVEKESASTTVLVRISQTQDVEATRIITIPSRIERKAYRDALAKTESPNPVIQGIEELSVQVKFGRWSKAGIQARKLLKIAPDAIFVKPYALIGYCQSGYLLEKEELRTALKVLGVDDVCDTGGR